MARRAVHHSAARPRTARPAVRSPRSLNTVAGGPGADPLALDRLIHERLRLGIVSALAAHAKLTFNELKEILRATDGNLSVHARKLEEAGYIACSKRFAQRVPRTEYRLTEMGRRALERYLRHMEAVIHAARKPR